MSVVSLWHILYDCHACNGVEDINCLKKKKGKRKNIKRVIVQMFCTKDHTYQNDNNKKRE